MMVRMGMANAFNDFFTKVGPLDKDIPNSMNMRDPKVYLRSRDPQSLLLAHNPSRAKRGLDESKSSENASFQKQDFITLHHIPNQVLFTEIEKSFFVFEIITFEVAET